MCVLESLPVNDGSRENAMSDVVLLSYECLIQYVFSIHFTGREFPDFFPDLPIFFALDTHFSIDNSNTGASIHKCF